MNEYDGHENGTGHELSDDEAATMSGGNFAWPHTLPLTQFLATMAERGLIERVSALEHDVITIKGHKAGH